MTPKQHGPWLIRSQREVYRDPWVSVRRDEVERPNGQPGSYCVVTVKPGVCVLALQDRETAFLTQEFHYGVGRTTIEAVSGGVEVGEDSLVCAKRELHEELGIEATHWQSLGSIDPFTANVVSPTELYLAEGLTIGVPNPESGEEIDRVVVPVAEMVEMVMASRITHGPSCALILKAARICGF